MDCLEKNKLWNKHGFRYSEDLKCYAAYSRLIGGKLNYETFKANAKCALPSETIIKRYIEHNKSNIVEGMLRADELLKYLNDQNLPKMVLLSEDATKIEDRIQYDSKSNTLVGFVLPLDSTNGMPKISVGNATSAAAFNECFYDAKTYKEKKRATYVNIVMAKPITKCIPAFCILLYGSDGAYSADDVCNRWNFIIDELKKRNIGVVTIASDSDPKFNSIMRKALNLGQIFENPSPFPKWFNAKIDIEYIPI